MKAGVEVHVMLGGKQSEFLPSSQLEEEIIRAVIMSVCY